MKERSVMMKPDKKPTFPVKYPCWFCGGVHEVSLKGFIIMIAVFAVMLTILIIKYCA